MGALDEGKNKKSLLVLLQQSTPASQPSWAAEQRVLPQGHTAVLQGSSSHCRSALRSAVSMHKPLQLSLATST